MIEITALIILALTNVCSIAFMAFREHLYNREHAKIINALIARNSQEYLNHEMADKTEKIKVEPQQDLRDDLKAIADLTDEEFDENVISN